MPVQTFIHEFIAPPDSYQNTLSAYKAFSSVPLRASDPHHSHRQAAGGPNTTHGAHTSPLKIYTSKRVSHPSFVDFSKLDICCFFERNIATVRKASLRSLIPDMTSSSILPRARLLTPARSTNCSHNMKTHFSARRPGRRGASPRSCP
ncbi:hypothetical protein BV20DRAFT_617519 [Pilatotrama ljubarskyi]|nr:hypothetical protein BV20DRAFT_617519 [Pilatotrama ljubarskyi]